MTVTLILRCTGVHCILVKCWQEKYREQPHRIFGHHVVWLEKKSGGGYCQTPQLLNRNKIAGGGWQSIMVVSASFEEFLELRHYINTVYTISCCAAFNIPACQMTPRTEKPSHNRWHRLKLAWPRFVRYDEQIMFLHVYWVFCQMVHQAFRDPTEGTLLPMETAKRKRNNILDVTAKFQQQTESSGQRSRSTTTTWPVGFHPQHLSFHSTVIYDLFTTLSGRRMDI